MSTPPDIEPDPLSFIIDKLNDNPGLIEIVPGKFWLSENEDNVANFPFGVLTSLGSATDDDFEDDAAECYFQLSVFAYTYKAAKQASRRVRRLLHRKRFPIGRDIIFGIMATSYGDFQKEETPDPAGRTIWNYWVEYVAHVQSQRTGSHDPVSGLLP